MGASVKGAGTDTIRIRGGRPLHGSTYTVIPDQIETGTLMIAAAATRGDVVIRGCSFNTSCSSFRFGGRNLLVEDCRFWGPGEYPHRVSGRHNTLCLFEYYAMRYDTCRFNSGNWTIRNCTVDMVDRLINYRHGEDWMHEGRPLKDVTFENVRITNLSEPAVLKATEGNPLTLTLKNVSLGWRQGVPGDGMFITSPEVKMVLDNVKIQGFND